MAAARDESWARPEEPRGERRPRDRERGMVESSERLEEDGEGEGGEGEEGRLRLR